MALMFKGPSILSFSCLLALNGCALQPTPPATAPATQPAATAQVQVETRPSAPTIHYGQEVQRLVDEPTRRVVRLANGLTIILQENQTAPVVASRIYVKAGSLTEQQYMGAGISHVLEHLVAGASSAKRKEQESRQLLRTIGNDSNAYTSFDRTVYFITTTREKWPLAMDLLSDWTTNAAFTEEEFAREYQVVQREIEMGETDPARIFAKLTYTNRYQVNPARHPVIGYKSAFQKLTREDCQRYYQQMYVPENLIITVAGAIQLDAAQKLIAEKFDSLSSKRVPTITLPIEPMVKAPRTLTARADVKQARVQWAFPTVSVYHQDLYALDLLANILGGGESSLLVKELQNERQLVTSVNAASDTPQWSTGTLQIDVQLAPEQFAETQRQILRIVKELTEKPLDPAVLEKSKSQLSAEFVYANQTPEQQAERAAEDFFATGSIEFSKLYLERIRQVTPAQIQEAAIKYLKPSSLLTTALIPNGVNVAGLGSQATTQTAQAQKLPVRKITLENGLTVLIGRNSAAPLVSMHLYVLGGVLAEDPTNNGIGNAMMQMLPRGTATRSAAQIADFFDRTGGNVQAISGNNTFGVSVTCLKEKAAESFELFSDLCLHPSFQAQELERLRPQLLAQVEHATESWFGEGMAFLRQNYYEKSPYKLLPTGTSDVVSKLTVQQLQAHYQSRLLDPRHGVLAIYGDIDPDQVAGWISSFKTIAPSKATLPTESLVAGQPKQIQAPTTKESSIILVGYGPGMTFRNPDRYAMALLQTILGGYTSPSGWIFDELRGQGLVYVAQTINIPGQLNGLFLVAALGEPANTPKILSVIDAKVADAKQGKFTDQEIEQAKDQAITSHELQEQTITGQASEQAFDELVGRNFDNRELFTQRLRQVTREDLIRVARTYLTNPVVAVKTPTK